MPSLLKSSDEGTIAVINYNYALGAGLKTTDAIAIEDASGDAAQTYANIIAVRRGNENDPSIVALVNRGCTKEKNEICTESTKDVHVQLWWGSEGTMERVEFEYGFPVLCIKG